MNSMFENASKAYVGSKFVKSFRMSWILCGVAAYFGIRYLYKKGIFPNQTGPALDMMDNGIYLAKNQMKFDANSVSLKETAMH